MVLIALSNTLALSHSPSTSYPKMVKNNKGGRRGWATDEQAAFMRRVEPAYLTCQELGKRSLADFWPGVFEEWFTRWPETATGAEDQAAHIKAKKLVRSSIFVAHIHSSGSPLLLSSASSNGSTTIAAPRELRVALRDISRFST